ncbi:MAG: hypothetical protein ABEL76_08560, partial [Bradymonadaceae bacterium]
GKQLNASGNLDLDVSVVDVSGELKIGGRSVTSANGIWGQIVFDSNRGTHPVSIGRNRAGRYETRMYAGTYDVRVSNPTNCTGDPDDSPLPCQTLTTHTGTKIQASGQFNLDVPVVDVSGNVTMNNRRLPGGKGGGRGRLVFRRTDAAQSGDGAARSVVPIDEGGPGNYQARLYPGQYDVLFERPDCDRDSRLPCQRGRLEEGLPLEASGSLDLNLPVVRVNGAVTVGGSRMGSSVTGRNRGSVVFERIGLDESSSSADVGANGRATYEIFLFAGKYRVSFSGSDCPGGQQETGVVPCMSDVVAGCK